MRFKILTFRDTDDTTRGINAVRVFVEPDIHHDFSDLGRVDDSPGPGAVKLKSRRPVRGKRGMHEVWFTPGTTAEETGNPESVKQDMKRFLHFEAGDLWADVYYAVAEARIGGTIQYLLSPGVGPVESDTEANHLAFIIGEEIAALREVAVAFGFDGAEFDRLAAAATVKSV